ncbi:hypothetical protein NFC81_03895 [Salinispirillum sp. LH 10-3-1]|uniref:DUF945 family protein n=1 Tax=Salinispirillum sp. LH 10-3-1 TaxID=2952525 RepID=A0AB38YI29_9GAMM
MSVKRFVIVALVALILWPAAGWVFLYSTADRMAHQATAALHDLVIQHSDWQLTTTQVGYRLGIVPAVQLHNASLHIPGLDDPLQISNASLTGRWYSLWLFSWLPDRVVIHHGQWIQSASEQTAVDLTQAWAIAEALPRLQAPFVRLRAIDIQQLDVTLYDPDTATLVDATVSAELSRVRGQEYQLQSIADLRGDGWVDHGFAELHVEWGLRRDDLPVRLISLDANLEVHSSSREYGIYRWEAQAAQLYVNPTTQHFEARDLAYSEARSFGREESLPLETGVRWALINAEGTWAKVPVANAESRWRAATVRRAQVERPRSEWVEDLQWIQQYDQWNTRAPGTTGRTEISWQARLNHPELRQILVQLNQQQSSDNTLDRWRAEPANIAIDVTGQQTNHVLRGRADALSDLDNRTLHLNRLELSEQAGIDTYWLYGHLLLDDNQLSFDDLIGSERGTTANPYQSLRFWADCYDQHASSVVLSLMDCSASLRQ